MYLSSFFLRTDPQLKLWPRLINSGRANENNGGGGGVNGDGGAREVVANEGALCNVKKSN
jgi:hypothetical protein